MQRNNIKTKKRWNGSSLCGLCGYDFTPYKVFYDGATIWGPWSTMCDKCFQKYGLGIGVGKGQMYDSLTFEMVAG